MCKYIIKPYDADGIAQCRKCTRNFLAHDLRDIYIGDLNHFYATYCRDCADKLIRDSVLKPRSECLTYNDIINALSFIMEKAENEAISEVDHISILECEITNLISRLQSESPSQTPSP